MADWPLCPKGCTAQFPTGSLEMAPSVIPPRTRVWTTARKELGSEARVSLVNLQGTMC